jgi:hypothetical protein
VRDYEIWGGQARQEVLKSCDGGSLHDVCPVATRIVSGEICLHLRTLKLICDQGGTASILSAFAVLNVIRQIGALHLDRDVVVV